LNLLRVILLLICVNFACASSYESIDKDAILMKFNIANNPQNIQTLDAIIASISDADKNTFNKIINQQSQHAYMILQELEEKDAPDILLYLAMVESHLTNSATSPANATGMWQFMPTTAKNFGLKINSDIDERRDPFESTNAAYTYLNHMKNDFGKWYLAVMGYNSGGAAIKRVINGSSDDFSALLKHPKIPNETKGFIKQIIKMAVLSEFYGTKEKLLDEAPNLGLEKVEVKGGTRLKDVGDLIGVSLEKMRIYNAHITKDVAPQNLANYHFYIPANKLDIFAINYNSSDPAQNTAYRVESVSDEEPLNVSMIDEKDVNYENHISMSEIMEISGQKVATLDTAKYPLNDDRDVFEVEKEVALKPDEMIVVSDNRNLGLGDVIAIP